MAQSSPANAPTTRVSVDMDDAQKVLEDMSPSEDFFHESLFLPTCCYKMPRICGSPMSIPGEDRCGSVLRRGYKQKQLLWGQPVVCVVAEAAGSIGAAGCHRFMLEHLQKRQYILKGLVNLSVLTR